MFRFDEIHNLTNSLPCGDHIPAGDKLDDCSSCNLTEFDFDQCEDSESFQGLYSCLSSSNLTNFSWQECDSYVYDKSLQPGDLSWRGEEWNSVLGSIEKLFDKIIFFQIRPKSYPIPKWSVSSAGYVIRI